jgi:hypothetical protein
VTGAERACVAACLEAFACGDYAEAAEMLLALEELEESSAASERRCPLDRCSWRGWPGALEHHLLFAHRADWDDVEELVALAA